MTAVLVICVVGTVTVAFTVTLVTVIEYIMKEVIK